MKTKNIRRNKMKGLKVSASRVEKWLNIMDKRQSVHKMPEKGNGTSNRGNARMDAVNGMMDFLKRRYLFRFNSVTGVTEYRLKEGGEEKFLPLDQRVMKRMALEVELGGYGATFNDVRYFLESDMLASHDPLKAFLDGCRGKWDGKDRIRMLANTVKCNNPHWADWFYHWFLGMVAQWTDAPATKLYGNSTVPLFISKQGFRKST